MDKEKENVYVTVTENESYYKNLDKFVNTDKFETNYVGNEMMYFDKDYDDGVQIMDFTSSKICKIVFTSLDGKSPGLDGVTYEDIKKNW